MTNSESRHKVYLDAAASCPPTEAALAAARDYDQQAWAGANPSSLHSYGRSAFAALEGARRDLARALGARMPAEVTFTSGGTESNNLAVLGLARAQVDEHGHRRHRVLVSSIEHDSILALAPRLRELGMTMEEIPVLSCGVLDLEALKAMLGPDVALVSVMAVNNELGTIQPVAEVARMAHAAGALCHTDGVQALGKCPLDLRQLGVDAASFTAHKVGGFVGCGALYVKSRTRIEPIQLGGGQERNLRSGTVDVRGALVFAAAAKDAVSQLDSNLAGERKVARTLVEGLVCGPNPVARLAAGGTLDDRFVPSTVCLLVPGHDSQSLVLALDERGFEVSGGSACAAGSSKESHVLRALGLTGSEALSELRISFDARVTEDEARAFVAALRQVCA